ncbi:MAG: glycosyltransferase [Goleter apudmare HA4340-LM2]|jgi:glycosyltransferase involved in cell wall biosynthesis|nr:glycosyltransferase [Goleter apudmare HA4340-LM2]
MNKINNNQKSLNPQILYVQYTNPGGYPPLQHSSQILAQDGWKVIFLGIEAFGASALSFPSHANIEVHLMSFSRPGWIQKLHYLQFCISALISTLIYRNQWVYASDLLSSPVAYLLSFFPGINVVYHEHDSPDCTSNSLFIRFCLATRKWLAARAKMCVLPNQQRLEKFASDTGIHHNLFCIWNCPSRLEATSTRSFSQADRLQILYHGSIVPSRLPITVLQALVMLPHTVKLRVIGYDTIGHQNYVQQLAEMAKHLKINNQVEFINAMPRYELLKWCRECDVGLGFMPIGDEDINMQCMVGASNKPFDYLACGLALLVSDLPDWKRMYVEPGYGLACNPHDPESIAAALRWYLEHPTEMRVMGDRGRQRILDEWNYETQFEVIKTQLSKTSI